MNGRRSRLFHGSNRPENVEGASPTRIDVDQYREIGHGANPAQIDQHIFPCGDAKIRDSTRTGSHATSGQIEGPESTRFRQSSVIRVGRSNALKGFFDPYRFQ